MSGSTVSKYAVVDCVVIGHQDYGLVVESDSGLRGFVDRADLGDVPEQVAEWPAVGDRVRGVVLGQARDGRLRLSARPRDLTLVDSVADPLGALREWQAVNDGDLMPDEFYRSPDARALLRWALAHPAPSPERERAQRLLLSAPVDVRLDILGIK